MRRVYGYGRGTSHTIPESDARFYGLDAGAVGLFVAPFPGQVKLAGRLRAKLLAYYE